jgi:Zn-dependent peptidase ImmA (M78 family)/DNA-binding XRE family transcriptional regulator
MRPGTPNFTPERLTEAREARGLSATMLAELCGVSRQSISAYEKGKQTPSPETLDIISASLNLPSHFFLKKKRETATSVVSFRSLSSATKGSRLRAIRRLDWLDDIVEYFRESIDFLPVRIPNFDLGEDPTSYSDEDIEDIAVSCRRDMGLGQGPISDMIMLIENHGAIIIQQEMKTGTLDAFSTWSQTNMKPYIVLTTDKESAVRSRMDVAHELGHLVIHRSLKKIAPFHKIVEDQAFRFASSFLLPSQSFLNDLGTPTLDSFLVLKSKWKVSIGAMIKRSHELNIINDKQATWLWINYNRRGWRKREPLDNKIEAEKPIFLRRCVELLLSNNIQSKDDILSTLALSAPDIESFTGLPVGFLDQINASIELLPKLINSTKKANTKSPGTIVPFRRVN